MSTCAFEIDHVQINAISKRSAPFAEACLKVGPFWVTVEVDCNGHVWVPTTLRDDGLALMIEEAVRAAVLAAMGDQWARTEQSQRRKYAERGFRSPPHTAAGLQ